MDERTMSLVGTYQSNERMILRHAGPLTNEDSYLQPQFEAISFNWTLGHIVQYRVMALHLMGGSFVWEGGEASVYRRDPAGVSGPDDCLPLADLLVDVVELGRLLEEALMGAGSDVLDEVVKTHLGDRSRYDYVSRLAWHETYHVGQLGLLRSLASPAGA
jgi:hypothetical protein